MCTKKKSEKRRKKNAQREGANKQKKKSFGRITKLKLSMIFILVCLSQLKSKGNEMNHVKININSDAVYSYV